VAGPLAFLFVAGLLSAARVFASGEHLLKAFAVVVAAVAVAVDRVVARPTPITTPECNERCAQQGYRSSATKTSATIGAKPRPTTSQARRDRRTEPPRSSMSA
jgi:hypothetical protein